MKTHDPELEQFKRSVDLVEYSRRTGYELRPNDGAVGLAVLDHPNRDRIVVGRHADGPWIYASVPDYALRPLGEPAAHALSRLRHCIDRATDKGTIVEFVQERDWTARRAEVPLDLVRERLREFRATGVALDFEGPLRAPASAEGRERFARSSSEVVGPTSPPELNQRRYDWSAPVPGAPRETEVEERRRRWREAQAAVDRQIDAARDIAAARQPAGAPSPARDASGRAAPDLSRSERGESLAPKNKSELERRRYDWNPAPPGVDPLVRPARNRGPDRDR
jgi:hypothetical protein